jgi:hypothetical protein
MTLSFYRKGLIAPYALCAAAGLVVVASRIADISPGLDLIVEVSVLILSGSVIVLPVYTIMAFYLWRRSYRPEFSTQKAHEWLMAAPPFVAVSIVALFGIRGLGIGRPLEGIIVGLFIGAFAVPVGYFLVFAMIAGARLFRQR